MTYEEFKAKLKECKLTIKEFANLCGLHPNSISTTWKNGTPKWVDVFLDNYLIAKNIDEFCEKFCSDKKADNE